MFSVYFVIVSLILFVPLFTGNIRLTSRHENISINFFLMNSVVIILCLLTIFSPGQTPKGRQELRLILLMNVSTILRFLASSCLIFYIMFEVTFVLIFFFIMRLGQKIERKMSSYYMFFFTLVFSLPLLIILVTHEDTFKSFDLCINKRWIKYW
jgi:NADH:ubiquinone oxidoreductase subunit 4 (subunit M)